MLASPSHAATLFRRSLEKGKMSKTPVNETHAAWKLAEDYGASKWLKHKDSKRFGSQERGYEYTIAVEAFYFGYQTARKKYAKKDENEQNTQS
jgi:hypothetical protein